MIMQGDNRKSLPRFGRLGLFAIAVAALPMMLRLKKKKRGARPKKPLRVPRPKKMQIAQKPKPAVPAGAPIFTIRQARARRSRSTARGGQRRPSTPLENWASFWKATARKLVMPSILLRADFLVI